MCSSNPLDLPTDAHAQEFMDEYLKYQYIGELYLGSMEDAFTGKYFDSIPAQKIQLFQGAFVKAKAQNKFGVYHPPQKYEQKILKDNMKRGIKIDLQQLNKLGNVLIESG